MYQKALSVTDAATVPRSEGSLILSTKSGDGHSRIDRFRTSGATKVAFPRRAAGIEAIVVNTSGGLTGGDRFDTRATAGADSHLILTTQAAERAYRSAAGRAAVCTHLTAETGATLHWLPQEMIVFDGAALDRQLDVDIADTAEVVLVEPVVFGRHAMGETQVSGTFRDRITLRRGRAPLYQDRIRLEGDISARLNRPAIANGMTALATAIYHGPRANALLTTVRGLLPDTAGASLITPDLLIVRLLAIDSFALRRTLVPVLEQLTATPLPKSWSL